MTGVQTCALPIYLDFVVGCGGGGKGGIASFDVNPLISTFWGDSCIFTFIIIVTILLQV